MPTIIETAHKAVALGLNPLPIWLHGKKKGVALPKWKQWQTTKMTQHDVDELFKTNTAGVALVTGKLSNLYSIDFDKVPNGEFIQFVMNDTIKKGEFCTIATRRPGFHVNFYCNLKTITVTKMDFKTSQYEVEILGDGHITIIPPSLNEGFEYTYAFGSLDKIPTITEQQFLSIIDRIKLISTNNDTLDLIIKEWKSGSRNDLLLGLTGLYIKHSKLTENDVKTLVEYIAVATGDFEDMSKRYRTIADGFKKNPEDIAVAQWFDAVRPGLFGEIIKFKSETKKENRFKTITHSELIAMPKHPIDWLVKDMIPANSICLFGGRTGTYKTWLTLDMAHCIASGNVFLDRFDTTKAGVLYIDEENGTAIMQERSQLLCHTGVDNLYFSDILGVKLDDETWLKELGTYLALHPDIRIVFVDTYRRVVAYEENEAGHVSDFINKLKQFIKIYNVAFLFTHHFRKTSTNNTRYNEIDELEEFRGSGDLANSAESVVVVIQKPGSGSMMALRCKKMRRGERFKDQIIRFKTAPGKIQFERIREVEDEDTEVQRCAKDIMEWFENLDEKNEDNKPVKKAEISKAMKGNGYSGRTMGRALQDLIGNSELLQPKNNNGKVQKGYYMLNTGQGDQSAGQASL